MNMSDTYKRILAHNSEIEAKIRQFTEVEKIEKVSIDGWFIGFIDNPSEAVQLAAVIQNGFVICDIENPSVEVQLAAVRQNPKAIRFIKNPSQQVIEAVVLARLES